jgi:acyl carrier protein
VTSAQATDRPEWSREGVEDEIRRLIGDRFDWADVGSGPSRDTRLREDLDLDSLHLVTLQVAVEDDFGVAFDPSDEQLADAFTSIGTLADYVHYLLRDGA